jgi:hypothetical protein
MKKVYAIFLFALIFSIKAFSQTYPVTQTLGSPTTLVVARGGLKADSSLVIPSFADTSKANVSSFIKNYAGSIIRIGDSLYMRNASANKWQNVNSAPASIDTTSLSNRINARVKYTDTAAMLANYLNGADTVSLSNRVNARVKYTDTAAMLANYLNGADTISLSNRINARVKYTDTATMLANYLISVDTISLSNRINNKVDSIKRTSDSVKYYKNGVAYFAYKDSVGGGSSASSDTAKVVIAKVHNATGTTLQRGEVVYLSGANGDVASVKRANNKQDSTSSKTFGIVRRNIAAGDTGYITTQGQIEKLNLGSFSPGDILWLDSIDGQFTKVVPQAPYHSVFLGVVERANNGNGLMYVKPQNGYELGEIHDVQINGKVNNQILVYSDTQKVWKNRSVYSVVDTTSLSNRINTKLTATDTASLSNRINTKLAISDTTVFQRKQLSAYSFQANNTNAAANSTSTYFKDTLGTYTGSITWNSSAPSGATNHTYRWTRIGKMVNLSVTLIYATGSGTTNTQVILTLPTDCPTPIEPTGLGAASEVIYTGTGHLSSALTTLSLAGRFGLRSNAADNGYELIGQFGSGTAIRTFFINVVYYTNQ